jgi:hypothetical protein
VALADRILPGFTTITTVPRYAGMLCLALKQARETVGDSGGESFMARRRKIVEHMKSFERAWALACGLAAREGRIGEPATDGLRGVMAVRRWLDLHANKRTISLAFSLLANQVRYGGIGAYGAFLEALHLADMNALTLRPAGEELGQAFPSPGGHGLAIFHDDARLPVDGLRAWGIEACAGMLTMAEAKLLRDALSGGEEAEFDDNTRWAMLRLLNTCDPEEKMEEPRLLLACLRRLKQNTAADLSMPEQSARRICSALRVIEPYERMFQCAAFLFDQVRAAALGHGEVELPTVGSSAAVQSAAKELRSTAAKFVEEVEKATDAPDGLGPARQGLQKLKLVDLARSLASTAEPVAVCQNILRRHIRVQEGKFDSGVRKQPWVQLDDADTGQMARLTAQRFGLEPSQVRESWTKMARHPYRTFGARRFIRQCKIR